MNLEHTFAQEGLTQNASEKTSTVTGSQSSTLREIAGAEMHVALFGNNLGFTWLHVAVVGVVGLLY